jgi:hypothetical protein
MTSPADSPSMQSLRDRLGPNLTQAHKRMSAVLKSYKLNVEFQDQELRDLVAHHPGRKIKQESLTGFLKANRAPYNRPCLFALVGSRTVDVSWVKCLRNLYEMHDKDKVKRQRVIGAFRAEAEHCKAMRTAHELYDIGACGACEKVCKLAVDHDGKPFAKIVDEFVEHKGMPLESVALSWTGLTHEFRCRLLAAEWHAWHDANAVLVGLCRSCNCSKGSGGYRHKK